MISMTFAGLSKSLNQRFFLVTLAPANPPREGRAKRVQGRIFDSDGDSNSAGGPTCNLAEIPKSLGPFQTIRLVFRNVLDYKLYIKRSIEKSRKKIFSTKNFFLVAKKPLFLAILVLTSQS